jgi:hypothetical protein
MLQNGYANSGPIERCWQHRPKFGKHGGQLCEIMRIAVARFSGKDAAARFWHVLENLSQFFTVGDATGEEAERDTARWGLISEYESLATDTRSQRKVKIYARLDETGKMRLLARN